MLANLLADTGQSATATGLGRALRTDPLCKRRTGQDKTLPFDDVLECLLDLREDL